ncbi:MAG: hypothetical protein WC728_16755 [Elusimicrobiota bacterium]
MKREKGPGPARRASDGQVIIPFLFVLPSFIILLIFLVEIGNLSTEKIRQQFALDAAATAQMEQYTDLLNRLAYINGVFPQRIFRGGMGAAGAASMLYPSLVEPIEDGTLSWPIRYGGGRPAAAYTENPPENMGILHAHLPTEGAVELEAANRAAYNYINIYRWLGDVAAAEKLIFERTAGKDQVILRKSMFYNLFNNPASPECQSDPANCGVNAAKQFPKLDIRTHYISGFQHCPTIVTIGGQTYVGVLAGAFNFSGSGLFQLATVPPEQVERLKEGYLVKNRWNPPPNHFGINLKDAADPYVRAHVSSSGGKIWPDTTPKFMTRLSP